MNVGSAADTSHTDTINNIVYILLEPFSDNQDHPEIWEKIASFSRDPQQKQSLQQIKNHLFYLKMIPQNAQAGLLISILEAVCSAFCDSTPDIAIFKLENLMKNNPDSRIIQGALNYIHHHKAKNSNFSSTDAIMTALVNFTQSQQSTNTVVANTLKQTSEMIRQLYLHFNHQLHQIDQSISSISRRMPRSANKRIRCVFLISFLQSWNTMAGVYYEMKSSPDFEPIIISTARKRAKDTHQIIGEELTHDFLESIGVTHIRLNTANDDNNCMDILKALEPDIIFRQSPWLDLPPVFNPAEINFAKLCYIPYSFSAVKRIDDQEPATVTSSARHTDLYYHRLCWRIFCETEMHKSMFVDTSIRAGDNVIVTGYPKFDYLLTAKDRPEFWPVPSSNGKRRTRIIWAPHHSVSPEVMNFGTFVEHHREIFDWAKNSEHEFEFVLKPHPALVGEVVHRIKAFSQEYMDNFFAEWKALPNAAIYEEGDYGPLFVGADIMLTDGIGFLSEFQLFEKPLIFIDNERNFGFNAAGEIVMQSANRVTTIAQAKTFCEKLRKGEPDPMKTRQQEVLKKIIPFPGESAKRILQAIRDGLREDGVLIK